MQKKLANDPGLWANVLQPRSGTTPDLNAEGARFVEQVMADPHAHVVRDVARYYGAKVHTITWRLPDDRGVRWTASGQWVGFV